MEDVQTELILSDLEICHKKRNKHKNSKEEEAVWNLTYDMLNDGRPVRSINFTPDQYKIVNKLPLITAKPIIFACNVDAESYLEEGGQNWLTNSRAM